MTTCHGTVWKRAVHAHGHAAHHVLIRPRAVGWLDGVVAKGDGKGIHGIGRIIAECVMLEAHHVHLLHILEIEAARGSCRELDVLIIWRGNVQLELASVREGAM